MKNGLLDRLDAEYHDPSRIGREAMLKKLGGTELIAKASIVDMRVSDPRKSATPGATLKYVEISGIDAGDGFVAADIIDAADAPSRARLKLRPGTVAMSSVRPARSQVFVTSEDLADAVGTTGLIVLEPRDEKELGPEALFALLKSRHVVDQLDRRTRASMYPTLAPEDVGDVVLPQLPRGILGTIEKAIGGALNERSLFLRRVEDRNALERKLFDPLGPDRLLADLRSGASTVRTRHELLGKGAIGRLDAEFHANAYDAAIARMRRAGPVKSLGEILEAADSGNSPAEQEYQLVDSPGSSVMLKVGALTGLGIRWSAVEYAPQKYLERERADVQDGDIVFNSTAHQPKYMAHKVDVVHSLPASVQGRLTFVGELMRLRLAGSSAVPPEYLAAFLRNPLGREQIRRCIRGISSHVYPDDVEGIVVPMPARSDAQAIEDAVKSVEEARWRYSALVREAIAAVESYVEDSLGAAAR